MTRTPPAHVPARKLTNPGGFADDETPTAPAGGSYADALEMVRLFDGLSASDKHEAVRMLRGWVACMGDHRVMLGWLATELAKIHAAEV